ncbi:YcbK family protein [Pararoseomonas baculiformis]
MFSGHRPAEPECPCCADARIGRRSLIGAGMGLLACAAVPGPAEAQLARGTRRLNVKRAYTSDSFSGVYFTDGRYVTEALRKLDWVFRDISREEVTPMDPRLFDVMHSVAARMEATDAFEVISGYRSPETNAATARRSSRVSTVSLHMSGMAGDMRLPSRNSYEMARLAARMGLGGVGLYRRDGFVHLDCGVPRRW